MRTTLLPLAFVLVACGRPERARTPATSAAPPDSSTHGPDQLALRFPLAGGPVRAIAFPRLDSTVWTSADRAPAVDHLLGFDAEAGAVAGVDRHGVPFRVDLHLGSVTRDPRPRLTHLASADGSSIYGIDAKGRVTRLTPAGSWRFTPPEPASDVIPEPDGSLLVLSDRGRRTAIFKLYPPDRAITDTAVFPRVARAVSTQVGDRVYFTVDSGLIGLRNRGLAPVRSLRFPHHVRAVTTTPSGDRIYVAADSSDSLAVIDRYTDRVTRHIPLPGQAVGLRMDPWGHFVLARPAHGDSAWVIDVGSDRRVGTVATAWRADLPTVAPNGWLALLKGKNVVFVDGTSLAIARTVQGGASDAWMFVTWNGFRPQQSTLPSVLTFNGDTISRDSAARDSAARDSAARDSAAAALALDSAAKADSAHRDSLAAAGYVAPAGSTRVVSPRPPVTLPRPVTAEPGMPAGSAGARAPAGFTVQFAALRSEEAAQALAEEIRASGLAPSVVTTMRTGIAIYRVVLGPYPTRAQAERAARASGRSYWIYEGAP